MQKEVSQELQVYYLGFLRFRQTGLEILVNGFLTKKILAVGEFWWDLGGYILADGGQWWVLVNGAGWWHSLV